MCSRCSRVGGVGPVDGLGVLLLGEVLVARLLEFLLSDFGVRYQGLDFIEFLRRGMHWFQSP